MTTMHRPGARLAAARVAACLWTHAAARAQKPSAALRRRGLAGTPPLCCHPPRSCFHTFYITYKVDRKPPPNIPFSSILMPAPGKEGQYDAARHLVTSQPAGLPREVLHEMSCVLGQLEEAQLGGKVPGVPHGVLVRRWEPRVAHWRAVGRPHDAFCQQEVAEEGGDQQVLA